jgi:TolA-binding protein
MKTEGKIKELEKKIEELEKKIEALEKEYQKEELKKESQKEEMEEWFKSLLNSLKIEIDDNEPDLVFYKRNGRILFRLNQNSEERYFWCDYDLVWYVLEHEYNLNYNETQAFIKSMVEQNLKLFSVTPYPTNSIIITI